MINRLNINNKKKFASNCFLIITSIVVFCLLGQAIGTLSNVEAHELETVTGWATLSSIGVFGILSSFCLMYKGFFARCLIGFGWCSIFYDYAGYMFSNRYMSAPARLFGDLNVGASAVMFDLATMASVGVIFLLSLELYSISSKLRKLTADLDEAAE